MTYYNKIGLLILNKEENAFLVVQKYKQNVTDKYIMPGGQFTENTIEECLENEIKEEIDCIVKKETLIYIGEYEDIAAGREDKKVKITLYRGQIIGTPKPKTEIENIYWITKEDIDNENLSPIIGNKILPDLLKKKILK